MSFQIKQLALGIFLATLYPHSTLDADGWTDSIRRSLKVCSLGIKLYSETHSQERALYLSNSPSSKVDSKLIQFLSSSSLGIEKVHHEDLLRLIRNIRHSPITHFLKSHPHFVYSFEADRAWSEIEVLGPHLILIKVPAGRRMEEQFLSAIGFLFFDLFVRDHPELQRLVNTYGLNPHVFSSPLPDIYPMAFALYYSQQPLMRSLDPELLSFIRASLETYKRLHANASRRNPTPSKLLARSSK